MADFVKRSQYNQICTIQVSVTTKTNAVCGSASGILVDPGHGYVITHASILYTLQDYFHDQLLDKISRHGSSLFGKPIFHCKATVEVLLPNAFENRTGLHPTGSTIHTVLSGGVSNHASSLSKHAGRIISVFEIKNLRDVIQAMLPQEHWQFEDDITGQTQKPVTMQEPAQNNNSTGKKQDSLFCYILLPCFVLIQIENWEQTQSSLLFRNALDNVAGDLIEICATPFGAMHPEIFLNCRSSGIISKVAGHDKVLLFTDARCLPGCEGGALFFVQNGIRFLTGMMIASLCWKNSEWVGLSLACSITELIHAVKRHVTVQQTSWADNGRIDSSLGARMCSRMISQVCCVSVGSGWGSGVYLDLDLGVILTCSHVLRDIEHIKHVNVMNSAGQQRSACDVIYRSPLGTQFDIAVLQSRPFRGQKTASASNIKSVEEGEVVYVVGYAIFRHDGDPVPMVTRGVVAKVNMIGNVPVMLQTTCAVHAGASGGGVFNSKGQLVAMVICNSRDSVSGASYPHVNMCVPLATLEPFLSQYLANGDRRSLHILTTHNKSIQKMWELGSAENGVMGKL
ncbi:peroxisomal leader peptide-processing protease-like isoform X1 [Dreissena polymorpha]|uniref:Peroxisomal leader peptide-processing protease n=1 Tax=Dreissena polymorpha TaxID=45954 RepID=A0A9D4HQV8_DREPO|nr:peroxisomal leader peptide-processing protease-like isoform X1 [Dreissena polymorpha]XP_052243529.1 peroxisomal leader peptide-processing protease-like isoform X1 [Dreissena polymorpha]XP_052243530.1 peroxisomal leader peptide-processing protease-like isoform X1 [Dreissena polymorpha]XP_052243531.1 peroxisomal leader peptide-processing protease-like isoform X1 [Dreissena polymorpha]XP_052243532.1 peroxisomal leader peptide-processing protease-like isoform X1 [Dreissena polymorpha]KAH3727675